MGYTITKNAVLRVQKYLEALTASNETIEWVTETPAKLAHRIHEGIAASIEYHREGEPYVSFARLRQKFVIRQKRDRVVAEWREELLHSHVEFTSNRIHHEMSGVGASASSIISEIIKTNRPYKITVSGASPSEIWLESLYRWTSKNDYFIVAGDENLIVTKDPETGEFAWRPPS